MSATASPSVRWILFSSLGPFAPMGHGWRWRDCACCLCAVAGHGREGGWEAWVWKYLTQGSPCSGGGPVSPWCDALTHWQHPSPSCHCLHARWDVLHRMLLLSVGTYDWPPWQGRDQPPLNLSCKEQNTQKKTNKSLKNVLRIVHLCTRTLYKHICEPVLEMIKHGYLYIVNEVFSDFYSLLLIQF